MQPVHHIGRSTPQGRAGEGLLMITGPKKKKKKSNFYTTNVIHRGWYFLIPKT